jgi:hypothetical protein
MSVRSTLTLLSCVQRYALDKVPSPIKVRAEGNAKGASATDLSPPSSPKRKRETDHKQDLMDVAFTAVLPAKIFDLPRSQSTSNFRLMLWKNEWPLPCILPSAYGKLLISFRGSISTCLYPELATSVCYNSSTTVRSGNMSLESSKEALLYWTKILYCCWASNVLWCILSSWIIFCKISATSEIIAWQAHGE